MSNDDSTFSTDSEERQDADDCWEMQNLQHNVPKKYTLFLKAEGRPMEFEVDSRAACSIITEDLTKKAPFQN